MSLKSILFCVLLFFFSLATAQAEVKALLVGVSDYASGTGIPDLRGPKNDVTLMRDLLSKRGVSDITVLAHDMDGVKAPTRQAILDALQNLIDRSSAGDLVYFHLSGHGTRQPDLDGDETDGLDEVFLPADAGKAPEGHNQIQNALTDDDIRQSILSIRRKGADVWFVMDSCHSGSGSRFTSQFSAVRNVDPETLGLNLQAVAPTNIEQTASPSVETEDGMGRFIAFYATKSDDVAREVQLSQEANGDSNQWYGLFTSVLASQLEGAQSPTYRQVFQAVLSKLNRGAGFGAAAMQTPIWEGDLIDEPVLGGKPSSGVQRYLLDRDELDAGLVHGLPVGTLVALVADVTDPPDAVIGYAQIEEAEARRSYLRPVSASCRPQSDRLCAREGNIPEEARAAQLELQPRDRTIAFSPVIDWQDGSDRAAEERDVKLVRDALESAAETVGVTVSRSDANYDVQIALKETSLWFAPDTKIGNEPVGLEFRLGAADERASLEAYFVRIIKAELFAQTLENLEPGNPFLNPSPVEIDSKYYSTSLSDLTRPGEALDIRKECRRALAKAKPNRFVDLQDGEDLKQCDMVQFSAKGIQEGQRDVNRIHIDAHYCINVAYELVEGTAQSRQLGRPMVMCSDCPGTNAYSAGRERLYFLISELNDNAEALNLTGLVENCTGRSETSENSRAADAGELRSTLEKLGDRGPTRGNMGSGFGLANIWSESMSWRVFPRSEAFARAAND